MSRQRASAAADPEPSAPQPQEITDADVPERPDLAEQVTLSGQMEDSAFADQPWLIQRGGGFVQVSELLYRLAEQCDGKRSLAEVAKSLGTAVSRKVSKEDVRQLLREKLIPMGLVPKADGTVVPTAGAADDRSLLQINARVNTIGPDVIGPAARIFQVLFWPPILLPLLGVGLAVVGWILLVHGFGEGLHDAIYQPWLILVLLPIIVASAFFHEFGHAAALTYGGGKVRGMGAGMYLVYPVFYTDVTDNYRLGRWAKVRTDTGGFYFNLLFAIAIMGIYLLTGQPFLLLAILAVVLSIIQQSLPFVRLDGYWTLADLTGVPDPLGQIGPFVRSIVPFRNWKGRKLPPLKTWVKVVFAIYILITVPLLAFLTLYMVASAPRILATTWDSFVQQLGTLGDAWSSGDWLTLAASVLGLPVLALTAGGIAFMLYRIAKMGLSRLWGWGKRTPRRRIAAGAVTLAAFAFVAWLWMPPLEATGGQAGPLVANLRPIGPDERLTVNEAVFEPGGLLAPGDPAATPAPDPAAAPHSPSEAPAPPAQAPATPVPDVPEAPDVAPDVAPPPVEVPALPVDPGGVVDCPVNVPLLDC